MHTSLDSFIEEALPALDAFDAWRKDVGVTRSTALVDHLAYQCGDGAEFEHLRRLAEPESVFLFQSMIAGRRIVLARLHRDRGVHTSLGTIEVIEIADQKPDRSKAKGFDHLEIRPVGRDMDALRRQLDGEFRDPRFARLPQFSPSGRKSNPTYDAVILRRPDQPDFKVRVRPDELLAKIVREEFR